MLTSLHTKYRPSTFDEVLGQTTVIRSLKKVVAEKRAHTFLFVGPPGTGKTTLARILAKQLGAQQHNLIEYDSASKSGADDVRQLLAGLQYKAIGDSPTKFVILDECHKLSSAAWTVLLKPTEEPLGHLFFAFCTTELGKIPKANITRALRYDLKPLKEDEIIELVVSVVDTEKINISDDLVQLIAENSGGSPRQALVFLEGCLGAKTLDEARQIMRASGQSKELIDLARWLVSGKHPRTWVEAVKYLKPLDGMDAEGCRITLNNYFASVLINQKTDQAAQNVLALLEAFRTPYYTPDKLAPLYYSVAMALGLDQ